MRWMSSERYQKGVVSVLKTPADLFLSVPPQCIMAARQGSWLLEISPITGVSLECRPLELHEIPWCE